MGGGAPSGYGIGLMSGQDVVASGFIMKSLSFHPIQKGPIFSICFSCHGNVNVSKAKTALKLNAKARNLPSNSKLFFVTVFLKVYKPELDLRHEQQLSAPA